MCISKTHVSRALFLLSSVIKSAFNIDDQQDLIEPCGGGIQPTLCGLSMGLEANSCVEFKLRLVSFSK